VSRFLIVRLGALGDIVHAIPVAAALRRAFPAARIDWLVGARNAEILQLVPVLDRCVAIKDRPGAAGGLPIAAAIRELRRSGYDVVFDLQGLTKSAILARLSGSKRVIGFSSAYLREKLARLFYTDAYDPGGGGMYHPDERSHVVDTNLGLLSAVGVHADRREFPLDTADTPSARAVREQAGGEYVLVNPGAAWPNKRWPAARYGSVARAIETRLGLRTVVAWGPGEERLAREVVEESGGSALLSAEASIRDLVALVQGARVMIAGDTGPMHIGSAVGTPIVGIYGPTRPSRNGPLSPRDITLSRDAICRCHHLRRCTAARMCLLDIEPAEVVAAVERRLAPA
jgi:lipopolysaccharide heptosyltransferase I